ncbi:hypothetical protein DO97_13215 [Neosynechococcus sphagnicola sy1]|uniref:Lipoprotein n=1 Tax=Neosynechococcus sphagnicola sy1 TaxID=1497020 RepID=A0A098TJ85_9CYAN|nr:hypothetical protein [Neosynechococcus sphagnicola]KGF72062.1 hypothetical protein DO97_13215 [Neosynechococcus sphagnicola sy1]
MPTLIRFKTVLLTTLVMGTVGCSSLNSDTHVYPQQVVTNFMDACVKSSNGKTEACTCAIDKIQAEYTLKEFAKIDKELSEGGKPPERFVGIVKECTQ